MLGHENLGEVIDIGTVVDRVKVGDRVCLPFNIACGFCRNCEHGQTGTSGLGADKGCECVGWQAHDPHGEEHPNQTMNSLVKSVRATGAIGVVSVFVPEDPTSPDVLMRDGRIAFDFGLFFQKGLRMGSGQAKVKAYNRQLRDLIHADRAAPSCLVSHNVGLDEAPDAYRHFDNRDDGWTKIVLHP